MIMEQLSLFSINRKKPETRNLKANFPQIPYSFIYRGLCVTLNRKAYQRSIRLYIKEGGKLQLSCALHTSFQEITAVLKNHWKWIQEQFLEQNKLRKKYPLKKFRERETFLFQGRKLRLKYEKIYSKRKSNEKILRQKYFHLQEDTLIYFWNHPEDLNKVLLKKKLRVFYEKEGKKKLQESLLLFSSRMQLIPKSIRIGSQKSLWGSCSSEGVISLNWRLLVAPTSVLNYVVIHELAHLKYLSHSVSFWSLVAHFCPMYKKCEHWLQDNAYAMDFLLPHSELHG